MFTNYERAPQSLRAVVLADKLLDAQQLDSY